MDFPIKNGDFPIVMLNYQRVTYNPKNGGDDFPTPTGAMLKKLGPKLHPHLLLANPH